MSFNTKKWLLFCTTIVLGLVLFTLSRFFLSDRSVYFRMNVLSNKDNIIFKAPSYKAIKIQKDILEIIQSVELIKNTKELITYFNLLTTNQKMFLNKTEYEFIKNIFDILEQNKNSLSFAKKENCQSNEISLLGCIPFLKNIFDIQEDNSTEKQTFILTKKKDIQFNIKYNSFLLQTYTISLLKKYFTQKEIEYFVIHIGNSILTQEKQTKNGWALQYSSIPKDLYYMYNQFVFYNEKLQTPEEFIIQDISYENSDLPLLELWSQYWVKFYPNNTEVYPFKKIPVLKPQIVIPAVKLEPKKTLDTTTQMDITTEED